MWPFRKKNTYLIVWSYGSSDTISYSDLVKAKDFGSAWKKLKKQHAFPLHIIKMERVKE